MPFPENYKAFFQGHLQGRVALFMFAAKEENRFL
jgi:hypothetical protein